MHEPKSAMSDRRRTKAEYDALPWLHIYGQSMWHDQASIVGTVAGLEALRDAINAAIERGTGKATASVSDGEGYFIEVVRAAGPTLMAPLPYTDPMARGDAA